MFACHNLEITTIEGLGNRRKGYHVIQKRLVAFNGSQCGYCSPGMVMNMYGLLEKNAGQVKMEQVENSFGGNICRCTGYRPILEAFKSLAVDAIPCHAPCSIDGYFDIEDLPYKCSKLETGKKEKCLSSFSIPNRIEFNGGKRLWIRVSNRKELFHVFDSVGGKKYMLVGGNTAHGVYRRPTDIEVFIQLDNFEANPSYSIKRDHVVLPASLNLSKLMNILSEVSEQQGYEYFKEMVHHIDLVANVAVRNVST